MNMLLCIAVLLPCALAVPMVELTQAHHLQTDVDMGKPVEELFSHFKRLHQRTYSDDWEEEMRRNIFSTNVKHIQEHNVKYARGEKSYYLGVNQFSDLTHQEFLKLYTGHIHTARQSNASTYLSPHNVLLPEKVDWRDKGYVTPVKNQKQCGSCWSFSATGSLEGQNFHKKGKLVSLSEQQLVDCSGSFGNQGCNGGLMDQAFEYIKAAGGLESEEDYPYEAKDSTCRFAKSRVAATVTGYVDILTGSEPALKEAVATYGPMSVAIDASHPSFQSYQGEDRCRFKKSLEKAEVTGYVDVVSGDEDKLQEAVATIGPISIAIDASHPSFQSYAGGIYDEPECSSTQLDHGVLVVGYGTDPQDYWLVKNSWSTSWGDEGYIKMARNKGNQCGVASQASYPLV